ncbi:MAG TPA: hypothetical protein PLS24_06195 [Sedimentisphaerales bacterium]|nr:hypothetical protein [Sedimentisphaerales bacterium]
MPKDPDERLLGARRLVAERCLYGVDMNPLAVELAKLSIWLVTLAKGRPFGFLDHNLRCGDSLLGIHRLDQLTKFRKNPDDGKYRQIMFFQDRIKTAVAEAVEMRNRLRTVPIRDVRDVYTMARLDAEARKKLKAIELVADAMIGAVLRANGNTRAINSALDSLAMQAGQYLNGDEEAGEELSALAREALSIDLPPGKPPRRPFHWPLEFPEVFAEGRGGFDAMIGNPPYLFGEFRPRVISGLYSLAKGQWDLCWLFVERALSLLSSNKGGLGFVLPEAILAREEPALLRSFVVQRAMNLVIKHVGAAFRAGVSVFTLCLSLKPHLNDHYEYHSTTGELTRRSLSQMRATPKKAWTGDDGEVSLATEEWVCLERIAIISRGEEVGKKHLLPLEYAGASSGLIPVVTGAGVVSILCQPKATHLLPAVLIRKKESFYESPKIIAVKTGERVRAGIDYCNLVTLQSVYNIHLKPDATHLTPEFLCALLVSSAANRRFIEPTTRMKKLFPQITQSMLYAIRIPPVDETAVTNVTQLVREWISTKNHELLGQIDAMIEQFYTQTNTEQSFKENDLEKNNLKRRREDL